jgi:hypothetical protein
MPTMTAAYERGWNQLTTAHYSQSEWPSEELIAPLVNDGAFTASWLAAPRLQSRRTAWLPCRTRPDEAAASLASLARLQTRSS